MSRAELMVAVFVAWISQSCSAARALAGMSRRKAVTAATAKRLIALTLRQPAALPLRRRADLVADRGLEGARGAADPDVKARDDPVAARLARATPLREEPEVLIAVLDEIAVPALRQPSAGRVARALEDAGLLAGAAGPEAEA